MITDHTVIKQVVKSILERRHAFEWKAHGLGFLRLYFSDTLRLHVWHTALKHPVDATPLHDHPWHLNSLVIAGKVENHRFLPTHKPDDLRYKRQELHCGAGGCLLGDPERMYLAAQPPEEYWQGDHYSQQKQEIHQTIALDGSVTLMERRFEGSKDRAHVYIPSGKQFISADFRLDDGFAKVIDEVCTYALERWF